MGKLNVSLGGTAKLHCKSPHLRRANGRLWAVLGLELESFVVVVCVCVFFFADCETLLETSLMSSCDWSSCSFGVEALHKVDEGLSMPLWVSVQRMK